jgi:hypothetical protein
MNYLAVLHGTHIQLFNVLSVNPYIYYHSREILASDDIDIHEATNMLYL